MQGCPEEKEGISYHFWTEWVGVDQRSTRGPGQKTRRWACSTRNDGWQHARPTNDCNEQEAQATYDTQLGFTFESRNDTARESESDEGKQSQKSLMFVITCNIVKSNMYSVCSKVAIGEQTPFEQATWTDSSVGTCNKKVTTTKT